MVSGAAFSIDGRPVGGDASCYIIAEAGVNHNGSEASALELVRVASRCGADAVKFQTFRSGDLAASGARKAAYQQAATGDGEDQRAMLARLELPESTFRLLRDEARRLGLGFLSTPFDPASAAMLDGLGMSAFKVPSGEVTNLPFLREIAAYRKPVVLSTGMSTLEEVRTAVEAMRGVADVPLAVLHCVSAYPAPSGQMNLRAIATLRDAIGVCAGLSDHSLGIEMSIASIALGAQVIEKHFTLDRRLPGPDHAASLEPDQLTELVRSVRSVESGLGDGVKRPQPCELDTMQVARRSIVAARDLPPGHRLTAADLAVKRPGTGLPPSCISEIIGRTLSEALATDQLITRGHLRA